MKNQELAKIFYEMADILELKQVEWKPRAYRKAAQTLESSEDIGAVYKKGGLKAIRQLPGVGENIAKKIVEYLETGQIKGYERLKKKIPHGLEDLMQVMSLGPKKIMILYKKLKIKNVNELAKAAKQGKIRKLTGFDAKSEENILESLKLMKKRKKRVLVGDALPLARKIMAELKKVRGVRQISLAGSLRRMKETIGDIDILVTASRPELVMRKFVSLPEVSRVLARGRTKSMVLLRGNIQSDVRVLKPEEFGSASQYFIGNKEHNIALREIAIKKGMKLSEYGLFKGKKRIAGRAEEGIYKKLGLAYIPPELRTNSGEIEAARKRKLPRLVKLRDIKGDLHVHSTYSDGTASIADMAKAAKQLGYEYMAITDHSKTMAIAHGLDERRLLKQAKEIDKLNKKLRGFKVFKASEVDILADGSLDFPDSVLKKLNIVVAAIHSGYKQNKRKLTERIVRALENKYVHVIAHPTGRKINIRPSYDFDFEQVFAVAREKKKFFEINAFPARLDLRDVRIREAVEAGVQLSIGTDSHGLSHLQFMELGVAQARRGWAEKKDILNTLSYRQLVKRLRL